MSNTDVSIEKNVLCIHKMYFFLQYILELLESSSENLDNASNIHQDQNYNGEKQSSNSKR
jgi:hypothetical protein